MPKEGLIEEVGHGNCPCHAMRPAASQGLSITILMEFFPLLYAIHCLYNFQIDLSKDNNLFWNYPGLCRCSADLCSYLQVHAIKKPASKVEGSSESIEILISTCVWAAGGRWGVIAVLQEPRLPFRFPIENGQTSLFCFSLCPSPVLLYGAEGDLQ